MNTTTNTKERHLVKRMREPKTDERTTKRSWFVEPIGQFTNQKIFELVDDKDATLHHVWVNEYISPHGHLVEARYRDLIECAINDIVRLVQTRKEDNRYKVHIFYKDSPNGKFSYEFFGKKKKQGDALVEKAKELASVKKEST